MLQNLLKKRDYPLIVLLGIPENHLDLFTFILFIVYGLLKYQLVLPAWCDLLIAIVFFIITIIFKINNTDNQYKYSMNHSMSFTMFFGYMFLLEILS